MPELLDFSKDLVSLETVAKLPRRPSRHLDLAKPERNQMPIRHSDVRWALLIALLCFRTAPSLAAGSCELSVVIGGTVYGYSLATPIAKHPHGVLSEDGFYKVAVNETLLWFQLCSSMIFNHDPPRCFDCQECGGSSHCGMQCNALISNEIGGYPVCTTIGKASSQSVALIDKRHPNKGVTVKMSTHGPKNNCSLSVLIVCDSNGVQGPNSLDVLGKCNYATVLRHPSGCPKIISADGSGAWFGTLLIVIVCLVGAYLLAGASYRFFSLGIRGPDVVPNLDFWVSLPQRGRVLLGSLVRRLRGRTQGSGNSYVAANF